MDSSAARRICGTAGGAADAPGSGGVLIRPLGAEALPALSEIERRANRVPWSEKLLAQEFENRFSRLFGAFVGEKQVGFLVAHVVLDEAHVVNLAVAPEWRRMGIGRLLLDTLLRQLFEEGARWAYLEVRESNTPALILYGSLGFYRVALRQGYYSDNGESTVLMNLELSSVYSAEGGALRRAAG